MMIINIGELGAKAIIENLYRKSGQPYLPLAPMPSGSNEIGSLEPRAKWRCIHCGRPNWADRLTCEGCGAPEGE